MHSQVLATFTERDEARSAANQVARQFPDVNIVEGDQRDALDALVINQQAETSDALVATSGVWTGAMSRGALFWGFVGLIAGVVLAIPLVLLFEWPVGQEVVFVVASLIAGGLALSAWRFVMGGATQVQREQEDAPEDPMAVLRLDVPDREREQVVEALSVAGARSIRDGDVLPNRPPIDDVETPRPLPRDPDRS